MKTITITESITAQEIYNRTNNKTSKGMPILWSTNWYEKEDFFTKEKTRPGTYTFSTEITNKGKTQSEAKVVVEKDDGELLSFAEWIYIMVEYEKQTGDRLFSGWEYTWTSSLASDGRLVYVGVFDDEGAVVSGDSPGNRHGYLGVSFSRRTNEIMESEPLISQTRPGDETVENAIQVVKDAGYIVYKQL